MVMREVILMRHFGAEYPVSVAQENEFLEKASASELRTLMLDSLSGVVQNNGLDTSHLRQASFFTRFGKNRVGGDSSYGTPKELLKLLMLMEQGKLVDEFSSQDLKRMLYMTERRIRYASHPALDDMAVYFKSGSLYSCQPEEGFTCGKYMGNKRNQLASVAIVESPDEPQHATLHGGGNVERAKSQFGGCPSDPGLAYSPSHRKSSRISTFRMFT